LQLAVSAPGVIAGERRPRIRERLEEPRGIEPALLGMHGRDGEQAGGRQQQLDAGHADHLRVTRYAVTLWMSASVYVGSKSRCGFSGSRTSTFGLPSTIRHEARVPSTLRMATEKSSSRSISPSTVSPEASVTRARGGVELAGCGAPRPVTLPGIS